MVFHLLHSVVTRGLMLDDINNRERLSVRWRESGEVRGSRVREEGEVRGSRVTFGEREREREGLEEELSRSERQRGSQQFIQSID